MFEERKKRTGFHRRSKDISATNIPDLQICIITGLQLPTLPQRQSEQDQQHINNTPQDKYVPS